jgi:membrane-bound lytic murein transglycosylase D
MITAPESLAITRAVVTREAVALFGDSAVVTVTPDVADAPTFDIDVRSYETRESVEHFVALFTGDAKDRIAERLSVGTQYEPMVRAKLHAAGLPEDLVYLAMVESGFSPDARSRAAAVGLWQFMTSTARSVGLRVDWWVDERRDPARSTDAAIRHLLALRREFDGSLYLAAAAYNGGSSRISRGLTRYATELEGTTGDDAYFALADKAYLRTETRNYVPQIIAIALVAKNAAKYGLSIKPMPVFAYDSMRVGPSMPLAAVAHASGTALGEINRLNPQILRGVTPPKDSVFVHIPVGTESIDEAIRALPAAELTAYSRVKSATGETFAAVAKRVGLSSQQLAWYNPSDGARKGKLPAGTTILVPSRAVVQGARDVPDPAIEIYGSSTTAKKTTLSRADKTALAAGGSVTHVVQSGETLGGIGKAFGVSVAAIKAKNGLTSDIIRAGRTLIIR